MTDAALRAARIIWDYHHVGHTPVPADVIIALGTNDLRVADFAARLFHAGFGPLMVCTGGVAHQNDLLATNWSRTEAEMYAEVALQHGVPREKILLETQATNTSENIRFARDLLADRGIKPTSTLFAVKNFMQRRVWATLAVEWPGMPSVLASPPMTLDQYFTEDLHPERIINIMMGDLQRLWVYARRGWSAPQRIPGEVMEAYLYLAQAGFTKHLIEEG